MTKSPATPWNYKMSHARNSNEFCWLENRDDLDDVFDMVTEAPATFIASDLFTANVLALFNYDSVNEIVASVERFKQGHLQMISCVLQIAREHLYYRNEHSHRLNWKDIKSFIFKCLSVIGDHSKNNLMFKPSDTRQISKILAKSLLSKCCKPSIPQMNDLQFPSLSGDIAKFERLICERSLQSRRVASTELVGHHMRLNHKFFMYYYVVGLLSKFVAVDVKRSVMILRDITEVSIESPSQAVCDKGCDEALFHTTYARLPTLQDLQLSNYGGTVSSTPMCIITACLILPVDQLVNCIVGKQIFKMLKDKGKARLVLEVEQLKLIHADMVDSFSYRSLPWSKRSGTMGDVDGNLRLKPMHYKDFFSYVSKPLGMLKSVYGKTNLIGLVNKLMDSFRVWDSPDVPLLPDMDVCVNPAPVPFIDALGKSKSDSTNIQTIQRCAYHNCMMFAIFYLLHWLRRVAVVVPPSTSNATYLLAPLSHKEVDDNKAELVGRISVDVLKVTDSIVQDTDGYVHVESSNAGTFEQLDISEGVLSIKTDHQTTDAGEISVDHCNSPEYLTPEGEDNIVIDKFSDSDIPTKKSNPTRKRKRSENAGVKMVDWSVSRSDEAIMKDAPQYLKKAYRSLIPHVCTDNHTASWNDDGNLKDDDILLLDVETPEATTQTMRDAPSYLQKAYRSLIVHAEDKDLHD